jgi:hypothetical protein
MRMPVFLEHAKDSPIRHPRIVTSCDDQGDRTKKDIHG